MLVAFRLAGAYVLVGIGLSSVAALAATPAELASHLRETLSGMHTVEVVYQTRTEYPGGVMISDQEWVRSGEKAYLSQKIQGQSIWQAASFDGSRGYSANWVAGELETPGEGERLQTVITTASVPEFFSSAYVPGRWWGESINGLPGSLVELLASPSATVTETDTIDGLSVVRVDLGLLKTVSGHPWHVAAAFCPGRDGLPVEIQIFPEATPPDPRLTLKLTASDFRQIEDTALARQRWLPFRLRVDHTFGSSESVVSTLVINRAVPAARFGPPAPEVGTLVGEQVNSNVMKVREHREQEARQRRKAAADAAPLVTSAPPVAPAVAEPSADPDFLTISLWAGTGLLFGLAFLFWLRSRG